MIYMNESNFLNKIIESNISKLEIISPETIKESNFIAFSNKTNKIKIIKDSITSPLSFNDKEFTFVFFKNPFNNIDNFREIFVEINRILEPNGIFLCLFNEKNNISKPLKWQKMYLNQLIGVTGFKNNIESVRQKINFWMNQQKTKNILLNLEKISNIKESYSKKCYNCGKPLGKKWKINEKTKELIHEECPIH